MSDPSPQSPKAAGIELERLMFFSDAVFAIAITLLVLEIKVPEREAIRSSAEFAAYLGAEFPRFFAFVLSFFLIGYYWLMHHTMFRYIRRWDDALLVLDLVLMMCVAFLPFPVALLGGFRHQPLAMAFYSGAMALTGLVQGALWWHASRRRRLTDAHLSPDIARYVMFRALVLPVILAISLPLAFINTLLSMLSWVLVVPAMRIVGGRLKKRAQAAGH